MTIQAPGEPVPALLEKYSGFSFEESCGLLMVIFRIIYHRTSITVPITIPINVPILAQIGIEKRF